MRICCTNRFRSLGFILVLGILISAFGQARPAEKKRVNTAIKPVPKDVKRHEGFVKLARKGHIALLFLGDSITDGWRGKQGKPVWDKYFAPFKAANFGIGGDRTQHVLWRIEHGELEGIHPRVVVLMIGTNNMHNNTAEEIVEGNKAIVHHILHKLPHTKVLLLGIFPRGAKPGDLYRAKIKEVNDMLAKMDDGSKHVRYLDIGDKFLDENGNLPKDIMPDALHPNRKGYEIWAKAILPTVKEMMNQKVGKKQP